MSDDDILSERIDCTLESQGSEKYEGHHRCHRKSGGIEFADFVKTDAKIAQTKMKDFITPEHVDQAQNRGERLGENRRPRSSGDAEFEDEDEEQIQSNIQNG